MLPATTRCVQCRSPRVTTPAFERVDRRARGHEPVRAFKVWRDREKAERELADRNAAEKARLHVDRQPAACEELAAVRGNADEELRTTKASL